MTSIKLLAAAVGALVVGLAMSQGATAQTTTQRNNMQNHNSMQSNHNMMNMWKAMDTNGDGSISMSEYTAHAKQIFQRADTNRNGKLSKQEVRAAMRKMHPGHMHSGQMNSGKMNSGQVNSGQMNSGRMNSSQMNSGQMHQQRFMHMWKAMDTNGDGSISMSEAKAYNNRMFRQADTNGDGKLSKSEWMNAMAKMRHHNDGGNGNAHW